LHHPTECGMSQMMPQHSLCHGGTANIFCAYNQYANLALKQGQAFASG
jgi:hypothetical protein